MLLLLSTNSVNVTVGCKRSLELLSRRRISEIAVLLFGKGLIAISIFRRSLHNSKNCFLTLPFRSTISDRLKEEMKALRKENEAIRKELAELRETIEKFTRMQVIPAKYEPVEEDKKNEKSADEDFDLFGSDDEEDAEKAKVVEERLKAYAEKKSKKPGPIAKSSVILDVKPWDDETDLKEMESLVRGIEMDGLVWGGAKNLPIGYGISKLQIICVIEDDKVSVDDLIDKITGDFESHVQSVDIVAFNKI
uniref:Elongation factor 1-beta n=1 Tax=Haemonchus contortus TaxID=6289 RepID=A0A7I5E717_HAECO